MILGQGGLGFVTVHNADVSAHSIRESYLVGAYHQDSLCAVFSPLAFTSLQAFKSHHRAHRELTVFTVYRGD